MDASGLKVWAIRGEDLNGMLADLKAAPGVLSVAAFGNAVHVAGQDAALLEAALHPLRQRAGIQIEPTSANLEDVFISLIATAPDNFSDPNGAGPLRARGRL